MLRVEREGTTVILTLDRPETKNALGWETLDALTLALDDLERDRSARAVILTGGGGTFASGGDLRELRTVTTDAETRRFVDVGEQVCARLERLPVPVLAAISGFALGGGAELALACDLRLCDPRARIAFKQVRMGVTTAWGTIPRLVSVVGHGGAARLLYTGQEVHAGEARAMGLVDHVTEDGAALLTALAWAQDIASGSPAAVAEMKGLLALARAPSPQLSHAERERFVAMWLSADHHEALNAYFARRSPRFRER